MQIQPRETTDLRYEDQRWLGNGGQPAQAPAPIVLDKSAFTSAFPNGYIPSGVVVGKITATGLYAPYSNAASNGTETAAGLIFAAVPYDRDGAAGDDLGAALMYAGEVFEEHLPTGHGLDAAGRTDMKLIRFVPAPA